MASFGGAASDPQVPLAAKDVSDLLVDLKDAKGFYSGKVGRLSDSMHGNCQQNVPDFGKPLPVERLPLVDKLGAVRVTVFRGTTSPGMSLRNA
ncbi:hypothetical protein MRX96_054817 [Rhipicephalus microplus]